MTRTVYAYVILVAASFSFQVTNQIPPSPTVSGPTSNDTSGLCYKSHFTCSDCNTLEICVTGRLPLHVPCSGEKAFCNDGKCSKTAPLGFDCPTSAFSCPTKNGMYPDASDCSIYHLCVNSTAYDYNCRESAYSVKTKTCSLPFNTCSKVNCTGLNGEWRSHPDDPQIMFLCVRETAAIIDICPKNLIYSDYKQKCVFKCYKEGPTADPEDPTKFYECIREDQEPEEEESMFLPFIESGHTFVKDTRDKAYKFDNTYYRPTEQTSEIFKGMMGDTSSFVCSREKDGTTYSYGGYYVYEKVLCYKPPLIRKSISHKYKSFIHRDCPPGTTFNEEGPSCD